MHEAHFVADIAIVLGVGAVIAVLARRLVLREGMEFSVDKADLLQQIVRDMEVPPWK